ncbi:MmcQ/YjbR family DNA-binding protein [Paenibacillus allorhizosphaerae]|uniref:MmcQ/YjbR family DNA-binding protein n=1 Tax=Paenibacillus allorhizosphaerae TaxID=2849866 RepID=A0ABM8VEA4_9BACL|nr:MmcQ/YjbR family DNA-binding protein [Paenibacillus allorhizosphaerae]CAG7630283.1 hypothetical protein PAECIP111802_01620 [Paenibacillus allorhizosphaerae]
MGHDRRLVTKEGQAMLEQVRHICAELPEVEEIVDGFGHITLKVRGKSFVIMGETEEGASLSFKSDLESQHLLLQQSGSYVKTRYIGQHGWVSTKMGAPLNWEELSELLKEAYLRAAPKRLARQLLQ